MSLVPYEMCIRDRFINAYLKYVSGGEKGGTV